MARTKKQKGEIIEKLETVIAGAKSLVFVNFHGLKVAEATAMRRKLKDDSVGFFVAKKTLTNKVLDGKKYEGTQPVLVGEIGLVYGTDLVAPARGVHEFQIKFKDKVAIVGGVFEGKYMTKEAMIDIASIPPLKTLYGMFANVVNSPIQGFVTVLDRISKGKVA